MSQSLASIKIHLIFSTKFRMPWLDPCIRRECFNYLAVVAQNSGSKVYEIGGMSDHVHLLLTLPRTLTVSKLVEQLKTSTSKWIKSKRAFLKQFAWQSGYSVFSVSESQTERVQRYIQDQEIHHQKSNFQDEIIRFLKASKVEFNQNYLLD